MSCKGASTPFYISKKSIGNADWPRFHFVKTSSPEVTTTDKDKTLLISRRYDKTPPAASLRSMAVLVGRAK